MEAKKRPKIGGRRKGSPNKLTATACENIIAVFTRLGGTAAMAEWARESPTEFYKIYARLIPAQAQLDVFNLDALGYRDARAQLRQCPLFGRAMGLIGRTIDQ